MKFLFNGKLTCSLVVKRTPPLYLKKVGEDIGSYANAELLANHVNQCPCRLAVGRRVFSSVTSVRFRSGMPIILFIRQWQIGMLWPPKPAHEGSNPSWRAKN